MDGWMDGCNHVFVLKVLYMYVQRLKCHKQIITL